MQSASLGVIRSTSFMPSELSPKHRPGTFCPQTSQSFPVAHHTTSFWRTTPHALDTFRSSEIVPAECDIAIIGAGLAGVSTAYHILSSPGPKPSVAIFEAREACSGATGRNGGHTKTSPVSLKSMQAQFGTQVAAEFAAVQAAQLRAMKAVVEKEEIECDFLVTRSFDVFFDEEQAAEMKAWVKEQHDQGADWLSGVQWLEGPNLERITGVKGVKGATNSSAASLWPYKFVTSLLARCLELGATLYTSTPVTSTSPSSSATLLSTPRGDCLAKKVVYATNGYSTSLLPAYRPAITPIRGSACRIISPPNSSTPEPPHLGCTYNLHYNPSQVDYLVPRPDGSIILGGGSQTYRHDRAQWFDTVDDSAYIESVKAHFDSVMPKYFRGWKGVQVERVWTGIMGYTLDKMPHVGQVPGRENEWMLAGFNGGGMSMIFTTAEAVARMVVESCSFEETGLPGVFKTSKERAERREDVRNVKPAEGEDGGKMKMQAVG